VKALQDNHNKLDTAWKNAWDKAGKYIPLALFIVAAFILARYFNTAALKGFLDQHEKFGFLACLLAYVLLGVTVIPSDPITLLVISWKGPLVAILLAAVGNTLSSMVEFYVGKSIGNLADFEKQREKLPFHLGRLPVNSPVFLIFVRLLTSYGSKFVSIAAGVYQVPLSTYLWTSLVSNLMGSVVTVFGGYGLLKIFQ
jgi:uncharacterized membrane protein YdjX (TVP38/TMEM64 family)